jgi:predicted GNAT superfamily acetyltransferase
VPLLVEIPADFQALKNASLENARAWRMATARLFMRAFADGWTVTDFLSEADANGQRRAYYILRQDAFGPERTP